MGVLHDDPNAGEDDVRPVIVRMDSMEIEAHAKVMPRIEILYMTNVLMIRYLLKKDFADMIPDELSHYYEDGDHNKVMYYRVSDDKKPGYRTPVRLRSSRKCSFFRMPLFTILHRHF